MTTTTSAASGASHDPASHRYAPRPALPPPPAWQPPGPRTLQLPNGVEVFVYDQPGRPLAAFVLRLAVSAYDDPAGCEGLADVTMASLLLGAGPLDRSAYAAATDRLALELSGATGAASSRLTGSVPASRLAGALELVAETVARPRFDADAVAHELSMRRQAIRHGRNDPETASRIEADRLWFADDCRVGTAINGTEESVGRITPELVRAFAEDHLGPGNAELFIAGDFSALEATGEELDALLTRTLGAWEHATVSPAPVKPRLRGTGGLVVVEAPWMTQVSLTMRAPAVTRDSELWPGMTVAAFVAGGSPEARLMRRLRAERGYTYGIQAGAVSGREFATFSVAGAVEASVAGKAIKEIHTVLGEVATGPWAPTEHDDAISGIQHTFVSGFQAPESTVAMLASVRDGGGSVTTPGELLSRARDTDAASAAAAFAQGVDLGQACWVATGPADKRMLRILADATGFEPVVVPSPISSTALSTDSTDNQGVVMGTVPTLSTLEDLDEALTSDKPVLVDFTAAWCGPCQQMKPVFAQICEEMVDQLDVYALDIDENQAGAQRFDIRGVPTFIVFEEGEELLRVTGAVPPADLRARIAEVI